MQTMSSQMSMYDYFGSFTKLSVNVSAGGHLPPIPTTISVASDYITASDSVLGVFCILAGAALLVLGFRLYKPTVFLAGSVAGGVITYSVLVQCRPKAGYPNDEVVLTFVPLAVGFVCGLIVLCVSKIALVIVGGSGGLLAALYLLAWKPMEATSNSAGNAGRIAFLCVLTLIGMVVILFAEKPAVIWSTSFSGAYGITFGVDCFAKTGFMNNAGQALQKGKAYNSYAFDRKPEVIVMGVGCAVLSVAGAMIQYRINLGRERHRILMLPASAAGNLKEGGKEMQEV
ncbi:hypothetical protein HDU77_005871 [Chytriomyces hyalinus]|nr:hypothetical protein HDU77_005871 [Chytriomyces hyalinus]